MQLCLSRTGEARECLRKNLGTGLLHGMSPLRCSLMTWAVTEYDLPSQMGTNLGRPDWDKVFARTRRLHPDTRIGKNTILVRSSSVNALFGGPVGVEKP